MKRGSVSLRKALSDPWLLGGALAGDSWLPWRILLIAAVGEPLSADERAIFQELTGRACEPGKPVHELVAIVGRRGGKSRAMAVLLCWLAGLCDHRGMLAAGESGVALCISRDQRIARIILGYVEGTLEASPYLRGLIRCSESRQQLIRRFAAAAVLAEEMEANSTLTRLATRIAIDRRPRDVSPTLDQYLHAKRQGADRIGEAAE